MANRVELHPDGIKKLLLSPEIKMELERRAQKVATEAQATADLAQNGAGGTIAGYAEAGFSVDYQIRGKRPQVLVKSNNTDPDTLERVYWFTQRRDGVTHLRAALYKFFGKRVR